MGLQSPISVAIFCIYLYLIGYDTHAHVPLRNPKSSVSKTIQTSPTAKAAAACVRQKLERLTLQVLCSKEYYTICSVFTGSLSNAVKIELQVLFLYTMWLFVVYSLKKKKWNKTTNDKNKNKLLINSTSFIVYFSKECKQRSFNDVIS